MANEPGMPAGRGYGRDPTPPDARLREAAPPEAGRVTPRSPRAALEPERVPEPRRASARARHPVVVAGSAFFTLIIVLALAAGLALVAGKQKLDSTGPLAQDKIVSIPRGSGVRDIADLLVREGVIDQWWVFVGSTMMRKAHGDHTQAGEYEFKKQASVRDVVDTIVDGKVIQHKLTIPEGLTSEQIVARLMENDTLTGNINEIPREGSLLPETYNFTRGTSREQMIQRMQHEQRRILQETWERRARDLPLENPEQLVVLASIVEKETGKTEERSRVAAVFVNRLKQRMKLQSDPTIIYGLVGGKGTLGRPIMRSEIELKTRYNTYVIDGLPPGPIANPGRASLEATASPARTKELFFVADGTGGHAFSETLEQHNHNVAKLRQIEQQRAQPADTAPAPAPAPTTSTPVAPVAPATPAPATARGKGQRSQQTPVATGGSARTTAAPAPAFAPRTP